MKPTQNDASPAFPEKLNKIRRLAVLLLLVAAGSLPPIFHGKMVDLARLPSPYVIIFYYIICLAGILLCFLRPGFSDRTAGIINAAFVLVLPPCLYLNLEFVTATNLKSKAFLVRMFGQSIQKPAYIILNCGLIAMVLVLLILLFNSIRVGSELCALALTGFAVLNLYVNDFRGSGITAADVAVAGTAMDVAGAYTPAVYFRVFLALLNCLLLAAAAGCLKNTRISPFPRKYWRNAVGIAVVASALVAFVFSGFFSTTLIRRVKYYNMMKNAYQKYGCVLTFSRTVVDSFPRKPDGYSPELAEEIARQYTSDPVTAAESVSEASPNVIVIINEAFSDLRALGSFDTNEDELTFFNSLTDNCISGTAYASVLGGRTANTEFEVLTGHSLISLPSTFVIPFQLYMNEEVPSLASHYVQAGYAGNFAFHPYTKDNYNRNNAYPMLGFEEYYGDKDAPLPLVKIRRHNTDESVYTNILNLCESVRSTTDRPIFAYCMTIQNHSPFDTEYDNFTSDVHVTSLPKTYPEVDQYLSLIKVSDDALRFLVEELSALDEPTVLLFVGDHQPSLPDAFVSAVEDKNAAGPAAELCQYAVPFKIWANYDLEEQTGVVTSMNYLEAHLADFCGGPRTGYQKYLSALHEKVPVITGMGYLGDDGVFYQPDDESSPYSELIRQYTILQYNCMFDTRNRIDNFFDFPD